MSDTSERDRQWVEAITDAVGSNRFREFLIHVEAGVDLDSEDLPEELADMLVELNKVVPEEERERFLAGVIADLDEHNL